ncbi:MAG: hypothetical protein AAF573_13045, partial [Bacteroidota bacterium]
GNGKIIISHSNKIMENKKDHINQEIQKTMESIGHIQRVEGNPFLYTRLQERLKKARKGSDVTIKKHFPVWQFAMVIFLLLINSVVLFQAGYFDQKNTTTSEDITLDTFAEEYALSREDEDWDYLSLND